MLLRFLFATLALFCVCFTSATSSSLLQEESFALIQLVRRDLSRQSKLLAQADISCTDCVQMVDAISNMTKTDIGIEELRKITDVMCDSLFSGNVILADLCKFFGTTVIDLSPWLIKELESRMWTTETVCAAIFDTCETSCCETDTPEQLNLILGEQPSVMRVSWISRVNSTSYVEYTNTKTQVTQRAYATVSTYRTFGWRGFIYHAEMTQLQPDTKYTYTVGPESGVYTSSTTDTRPGSAFTTFPKNIGTTERPLRVIHIADIDSHEGGKSVVEALIPIVEANEVDFIMHVGDLGYADGVAKFDDDFGRLIEPLSRRVPYMTSPGNHESLDQFGLYKLRHYMPYTCGKQQIKLVSKPAFSVALDTSACYISYSFDVGNIHFNMFATESLMNSYEFSDPLKTWLQADLSKARDNHADWVIAANHRPSYCTTNDDNCNKYAPRIREALDPIFQASTCDLLLTGHIHSYERSHPSVLGEVVSYPNQTIPFGDNSVFDTYVDPKASIHITQSGPNREGQRKSRGDQPYTRAVYLDGGFSRLTITEDVLDYEFHSVTQYKMLDKLRIVKTRKYNK